LIKVYKAGEAYFESAILTNFS